MHSRRFASLILAAVLAAAGCKDVSQHAPINEIVVATFTSSVIPTPNDLALQATPTLPASAQKDLLQSLVVAGGFPADQAPALSVPIAAYDWDASTHSYLAASALPGVDATTITADTAALFKVDETPPLRVDLEAASTQVDGAVTLVPKADASGSRRLASGRYVFAIRGGLSGVRTTTGLPIAADKPVALSIPNKDLSDPANQPPGGLSADQLAQISAVQAALWNPVGWSDVGGLWTAGLDLSVTPAFTAVDAAFPHAEVASIAAFQIAPATGLTIPAVDSVSGQAPLPFDLLRTGEGGTIAYNPAFGSAAAGLTSLDGFSTTAMMLAPVITPGSSASAIDASTVNGSSVLVYQLGTTPPTLLNELQWEFYKATHGLGGNPSSAKYVAEPSPIVVPQGTLCPIAGGCSSVIGLQPAVNTGLGLYLPPLEESTSYAVVITKGVHDLAGNSVARPTFMTLLLDANPLTAGGQSLVGGVDATTAAAIEQMRTDLAPVFAALPTGITLDDVALAYTFKTQSITPTALGIAALPYSTAGAGTVLSASFLDPATVAAEYGISAALLPAAPAGPIAEFAEVTLPTVSLLIDSQNSGAFDPANAAAEVVTALVAVPNPLLVTGSCPAGVGATRCAPLVVFRHGIGRSKADMLTMAAALTGKGFVVAAIDGEKHGDRSYCTSDAQCCPASVCGAATGTAASTCAFKANLTTPVDGGTSIGYCESAPGVRGSYLNKRDDCTEPFLADGVSPNPACLSPKGVPYVSANYLVSLNFFRTRDSLRQDIIDQSALVKALAPAGGSTDAFAAHLAGEGIGVDYTQVYWVSHSLGSIQGAVDIAVNPRISRAVLDVPGATVVDIFADPASVYHAALLALLAPIQENTPAYLQTLQLAKWILDPAEPANFGSHVALDPLVSPLNASFPNPDRVGAILVQNALCDGSIPNTENAFFDSQLGLLVPTAGDTTNGYVQWYVNAASGATCPADATTHGFLLDYVNLSLTTQAQTTAASFLSSPSAEPATVRP
ncbi:MAG TPA: hypothetical protein VMU15_01470 [Anaeromyxobacter sp.]|nr:hypothetical protein [Anaeromyxobacter sp.]